MDSPGSFSGSLVPKSAARRPDASPLPLPIAGWNIEDQPAAVIAVAKGQSSPVHRCCCHQCRRKHDLISPGTYQLVNKQVLVGHKFLSIQGVGPGVIITANQQGGHDAGRRGRHRKCHAHGRPDKVPNPPTSGDGGSLITPTSEITLTSQPQGIRGSVRLSPPDPASAKLGLWQQCVAAFFSTAAT